MRKLFLLQKRIKNYEGRFALVDNIPYTMPVSARNSPALMAGFSCDWEKANDLLPGNEIHALKLPNGRAALLITVINYLDTSIGKYIEYSIAIGCTHGNKPAPPILNAMLTNVCEHGARLAGPGEFTLRAFLAGRLDLTQAEAVLGVIEAGSQQELSVALALPLA